MQDVEKNGKKRVAIDETARFQADTEHMLFKNTCFFKSMQQNCLCATTHVIKQQTDGDAMKKTYEKLIKNQSQINQKWTNNRSNIARNRGLEASWRRLGASWKHFGVSWEV